MGASVSGTPELQFPHGVYGLWADDDDVIGLTVAKTYPCGYPVIRTDPPFMDAFDEYEVGRFLAWCLSTRTVYDLWQAHTQEAQP